MNNTIIVAHFADDATRVKIRTTTGDYINANYVNVSSFLVTDVFSRLIGLFVFSQMEIPGSGIVNRYIAAQGPLPNTAGDFWQMVWEHHATLVVMLTTNVERGRVKCHKYWPDLYDSSAYGHLQVTCLKEEVTPSFAFRELSLVHAKVPAFTHFGFNRSTTTCRIFSAAEISAADVQVALQALPQDPRCNSRSFPPHSPAVHAVPLPSPMNTVCTAVPYNLHQRIMN